MVAWWANRALVGLGILCIGAWSWGQTFTVVGQTGSSLNLDATTRITLNVQYAGTSTLTNVVPELTLPSCGQISLNGKLVNIFSSSYAGWNSGSGFVIQPIPSWTPGTNKSIAFDIHLFDNPGNGSSICADLCPSGVQFGLQLSGTGFGPVQANANGNLSMVKPAANQYRLQSLVIKWTNLHPTFLFAGQTINAPFTVVTQHPDVSVPGTKVLLYMDWFTTNGHSNFNQWDLPVANSCAFSNLPTFMFSAQVFPGVVIDGTGTVPNIGAGSVVNTKPFGGAAGPNEGDGINFIDVTNLTPTCGGTVLGRIGFNTSTVASIVGTNLDMTWRSCRLYTAVPQACQVLTSSFGPPPTTTQFISLFTDSKGKISAQADVPSAWKSGADLSSAFTIKWYLRSATTFTQLTDTGTDGIKLTLDTQTGSLPAGYFIEARITHTATNSVVSFSSPIHGFDYTSVLEDMDGTEIPQDAFLDPGETANFNIGITNNSGANATALLLGVGVVSQSGLVTTIQPGSLNTSLNNGSSTNTSFNLSLLASQACTPIEFFYEVQHTRNGFVTNFRKYLTLTANCQTTEIVYPTSPSGLSTWCASIDNQACGASLDGSNAGWSYDTNWLGTVSDPDDADTYFTLTSPEVNVGANPNFSLSHIPELNLNVSGGVLEYSLKNGSTWGPWLDLVTAIETYEGTQIYHPLAFPNNLPSYLAGRRVWMYNNPPQTPLTFQDLDVNPSLFGSAQKVRFRFVFQAPYLNQRTSSVHQWQVLDFAYSSESPLVDNIFAAGNLSFAYCDTIMFQINQVSNYNVSWYSSATRLQNNNPNHTETVTNSNVMAWLNNLPAPPSTTTTFYVKITDTFSGSTRILPIEIVVPQGGVPTLPSMRPTWRLDPNSFGFADLNTDNRIDVMDFIIRENNSLCD
ncbi:MAG: hypothetical protein H6510_00980 [Acidobacteria bacterium]|nr:hypothetical protein [Acidobacteriota bacterium]MCB9396362.1 hypothetical protein [Acidobacteriota bacterium]